jgi:RNA polymerase sigma factor (sigma-70 family)
MGAARDAEDVVHEAFVRALAAPPPRVSSASRAYLYRAVLAVLADRARRRSVRGDEESGLDALDGALEPHEIAERRELATLAARAVARLPAKQRAALLLRVVRHMDYDEIATALDGSVATARQHFYLAVKAVRDALAVRDEPPGRGDA